MKARLSFYYDPLDEFDISYINDLQSSRKFKGVLWELSQWLRSNVKHGATLSQPKRDEYISEEEYQKTLQEFESITEEEKQDLLAFKENILQEVRDKLYELINDENITLD